MVAFCELGGLQQLGEHHRLEQAARAIAIGGRQVQIQVGQLDLVLGNEPLARQIAHRRQQAQVRHVSGADLAAAIHEQAIRFGAEILIGVEISQRRGRAPEPDTHPSATYDRDANIPGA